MKISNYDIGIGHPCFITAEIGINHNGSVDIAKQLIDVAVDAGCQAVKFQKRDIGLVYSQSELDKPRESPWGTTNREQKEGLELDCRQYEQIDRYCVAKGILWFASAWDIPSISFLERFKPPAHKIASAMLTDLQFLEHIRHTKRPVIISTGMSTVVEIEIAANMFLGGDNLAMLVTTSTYPSKVEDLNLRRIETMMTMYPCPIGYSGHEVGIWSTVAAVAMGAKIVERHITLDRAMYGSDQAASVEPQGLKRLVSEIRDVEKAIGHGNIGMLDCEAQVREKLRRVE